MFQKSNSGTGVFLFVVGVLLFLSLFSTNVHATPRYNMSFYGDNFVINDSTATVNMSMKLCWRGNCYRPGHTLIRLLLHLDASQRSVDDQTYKYGWNFTVPFTVSLGEPVYFTYEINSTMPIYFNDSSTLWTGSIYLNYNDVDLSLNPNITRIRNNSVEFSISRNNFTQGEIINIDPTVIKSEAGSDAIYLSNPRISLIKMSDGSMWAGFVNYTNGNFSLYNSTNSGTSWVLVHSFLTTSDNADNTFIFPDNNSQVIHIITGGSTNRIYTNFTTSSKAFSTQRLLNTVQGRSAVYTINGYLFEFSDSSGQIFSNYTADSGQTWQRVFLFNVSGGSAPNSYMMKPSNNFTYGVVSGAAGVLEFLNITNNGNPVSIKTIDTSYPLLSANDLHINNNGTEIHIVVSAKFIADSDTSIYYYNTTNRGGTFSARRKIATAPAGIAYQSPRIINTTDGLFVFFNTNETSPRLYTLNSTDGGQTWSTPLKLCDGCSHASPMLRTGFPNWMTYGRIVGYLFRNITTTTTVSYSEIISGITSVSCSASSFVNDVYVINSTINFTSRCINVNPDSASAQYTIDVTNIDGTTIRVLNDSSGVSEGFSISPTKINFTIGAQTNYTIYFNTLNQSFFEPIQVSDCPTGASIYVYHCTKQDTTNDPSTIYDNYTIFFRFNVTDRILENSTVNISGLIGWFPAFSPIAIFQHMYLNQTVTPDMAFGYNSTNVGLSLNESFNLTRGEWVARFEYQIQTAIPPSSPPGGGGGGGGGGEQPLAICGNGVCEIGENQFGCPSDCANQSFRVTPPYVERFFSQGEVYTRDFVIQNTFNNVINVDVSIIDDGDHSSNWASLSLSQNGSFARTVSVAVPAGVSQSVTGNSPIYIRIYVPADVAAQQYHFTLQFNNGQRTVSVPVRLDVGSGGFFQQLLDMIGRLNDNFIAFNRPILGVAGIPYWIVLILIIVVLVALIRSKNGNKKNR